MESELQAAYDAMEAAKQPQGKRRDITVDAVLDIETQDWTKFVCGGFMTADGIYRFADWRHEEDFARFILSYEGTVWAHNGGGFDYKWLLDWLMRLYPTRKAVVTAAGTTMVACRIGKLRLFDSFALVKISLAEFSKAALGNEKIATGLECQCGRYCGGYCRISRTMSLPDWKLLQAYQEQDCRSLLLSLQALQKFAERNDLDIGATVGGSAWRNAQRTCGLAPADDTVSNHMFAREAYFGGRVSKLRPRSEAGWEFDVSAMYPSRLRNFGVPVGTPQVEYGKDAKCKFEERCPGIYRALVSVPRMHLCPLPVRTTERVIYPFGEFVGTWALPELELAEELGCTVTVRQALVWPRKEVLFTDWVDRMYALREAADTEWEAEGKTGHSPLGTFVKFYMNSLTGKFGSRPIIERIIVNPEGPRPCHCKRDCKGACGCYTILDTDTDSGRHGFIVSQKSFRIDPCAHVEFAAYLTSEARCEWLRQALSLGDGGASMVYGDTDSLFCERELTRNVGTGCGAWECKGQYRNFHCIAPKVYSFDRGAEFKLLAKGIAVPRLKGAPKDKQQDALKQAKRDIMTGRALPSAGVIGFRSGARNGAFFEANRSGRKVGNGNGDRLYSPGLPYTEPREYYSTEDDEESDDT